MRVRSIGFEHVNVKPFKNSKLRAAMSTVVGEDFQRRYFRADVRAIENLYRGRGYMDVDIVRRWFGTDEDGGLHIRIRIDSGSRWRVESVVLHMEGGLDEKRLRELLKVVPGGPFLYGDVLGDERAMLALLNNRGYAHAEVENRLDLDSREHTAAITYDIRPGRRMYFGNISIVDRRTSSTQSLRTRPELVLRHLTFSEGERFDPAEIGRSRNNLAKTDLFRSVTLEFPTVAGGDSVQPVEVLLQERKFIHLEGNGFLNNSEPGVSANLQDANWLGRGMRLGLDANLGRPLQGATAYVTERNILNSGADLTVSAGVTDEWGRTEVAADPSDSTQFALLTSNDSVLGDLLLFAGVPAATEYITASRLRYRSIERLWQFNGRLARSWRRQSAIYESHFGLTWTQSRNRPAGGGRVLAYSPGDELFADSGGPDEATGDGGFDDDPFGDDPFGDDPFGDDPFGDDPFGDDPFGDDPFDDSGDTTGGAPEDAFVDYVDGEIPIDAVWQSLLTDRARTLNFDLAFQRDTRDSHIAPSSGSFLRVGGLYAVQVGGQSARVIDGDFEARRYLRLGRHLVWANAARLLMTVSLREDRALPQAYWKEFGGEGSVRGVERQGIQAVGGGRAALNGRTELRLAVAQYGLVLFWDRAGVWRHAGDMSIGDMVDGYGLGIRYDLGIPFRLDTGWSDGFSERRVYFSIGQAF